MNMSLDKTTLQTTLETIFGSTHTAADAAQQIANAIDTYVKNATVNVTSVTGVTAGTATSGTGTGTLS